MQGCQVCYVCATPHLGIPVPPERFTTAEFVPEAEIFGRRLKEVRESLGVTQRELAEHARLPESSVAAYEARHRNPSLPALVRLAVACGVDPASAVFHARLRADNLAMRRAKADGRAAAAAAVVPALVVLGGVGVVPPVGVTLAGLSAGRLANAVSNARYKAYSRPTDRNEYKLFEAAVSAEPVRAALEAGIYTLADRPNRKQLELDLLDAARELSDEELHGLVAALNVQVEDELETEQGWGAER